MSKLSQVVDSLQPPTYTGLPTFHDTAGGDASRQRERSVGGPERAAGEAGGRLPHRVHLRGVRGGSAVQRQGHRFGVPGTSTFVTAPLVLVPR